MKKIPTIFLRDDVDRSRVVDKWHPDCLWVRDGEGVATRKYDGTCVMLDADGQWWARREVKVGKPVPSHYVPVEFDKVTGKSMGWEPIVQSSFAKFHAEALATQDFGTWPIEPGTYELVGPKINGNPEGCDDHRLISHEYAEVLNYAPRTFDELANYLTADFRFEGIVWHHPDGRMAKIKRRDFGYGAK